MGVIRSSCRCAAEFFSTILLVCAFALMGFGGFFLYKWRSDPVTEPLPPPNYVYLVLGFGAALAFANVLSLCGACCRTRCCLGVRGPCTPCAPRVAFLGSTRSPTCPCASTLCCCFWVHCLTQPPAALRPTGSPPMSGTRERHLRPRVSRTTQPHTAKACGLSTKRNRSPARLLQGPTHSDTPCPLLSQMSVCLSFILLIAQLALVIVIFVDPSAIDQQVCPADDASCLEKLYPLFKDPAQHAGILLSVVCTVQIMAMCSVHCLKDMEGMKQRRDEEEGEAIDRPLREEDWQERQAEIERKAQRKLELHKQALSATAKQALERRERLLNKGGSPRGSVAV